MAKAMTITVGAPAAANNDSGACMTSTPSAHQQRRTTMGVRA
jgi:hypothetical protein